MSAFHAVLLVHIAAGGAALLSGPIPMLSRKGGRLHCRLGMIYAVSMVVAAVAAFALALILGRVRFIGLAVFVLFLVFCGLRAIRFRRRQKPSRADDVACIVAAAFDIWLVWYGIVSGDAVSLFFGVGGALLVAMQWHRLRDPEANWLRAHLTSMGAAYVATVTAFLAVNLSFLPSALVFIAPALISIPLLRLAASRNSGPVMRKS